MFAPTAMPSFATTEPTPHLSRSSSASTLCAVPTTPPTAPVDLPSLPLPVKSAGRDLSGVAINKPIKALLAPALAQLDRPLRIVGLLATPDSGCAMYADMTARACRNAGVEFERLDMRPKEDEEEEDEDRFASVLAAIKRLNDDAAVDGLLVYFPLFGGNRDAQLRAAISPRIDVEGVSPSSLADSYARAPSSLDAAFAAPEQATAYPCTAAAVFRTLAHAGVNAGTVTIINRSETVGRPLAAMLANSGMSVYSIDITGIQLWTRMSGELNIRDVDTPLPVLLAQSDAVVSAVPGSYAVPTASLKYGAVCVDLSEGGNFQDDVRDRAGVYAPRVGAVTISMLMCNALVLRKRAERSDL